MYNLVNVQIETKDGINVVSSRVIAQELGKRHADVVNQIEKLGNGKNESGRFGIIESQYNDRGRMCKEYLLTKDGFTLYMFNIQGYNDFKMAYINRFNEMEKALREMQPKLPGTYLEALKALVASEEEKEKLLVENAEKHQFILVLFLFWGLTSQNNCCTIVLQRKEVQRWKKHCT